jgi:oligopeptide/dipeptide ABC transporter ATP-binding protein
VVPARDPRVHAAPQLLTGETPDPVDVPAGCRFHPRCPVAVERCSAEDPALRVPNGASHEVACLLA